MSAIATRQRRRAALLLGLSLALLVPPAGSAADDATAKRAALGRALFFDASLSSDGNVSCATCHNPAMGYANDHPTSVGTNAKIGTRNAPSLIGVGNEGSFFWDGRRTRLEDAVTDAFTNPVELGLASTENLLARVSRNETLVDRFHDAFNTTDRAPRLEQVRIALATFVRSLSIASAPLVMPGALPADVSLGKHLFNGVAGCAECHASKTEPDYFSDGAYHHSGVSPPSLMGDLPELARDVIKQSLDADAIGPKVLTDVRWSSLGRFVVTQRLADIGAYRTPSLRNVAFTAPYMHDGSVATLYEAVDRELSYRSITRGRPINLSLPERKALVAYLQTLR